MPIYDSTIIFHPQIEDAGFDGRIKGAVELIQRYGGTIVNENRYGMRRLAYEIQKTTQGYYIGLVYDAPPAAVTELERWLRLDELCLRFLTCHHKDFSRRRGDDVVAPEPLAAVVPGAVVPDLLIEKEILPDEIDAADVDEDEGDYLER